jgi:hypothetical protein
VNLIKNPVLKVVAMLALAIALVAGCAKNPEAPNADIPPETRIITHVISTAPDSATFYNVTVYWGASDPDGQAEYYRYWVDQENIADSLKTGTFDPLATVRMQFTSQTPSHVFFVQAKDNRDVWDSTPASSVIDIEAWRDVNEFSPNTVPVTVPPNGALTSRGVLLVINGEDIDGAVTVFQWAVDDTAVWHDIVPTFILQDVSTLELRVTPADLPLGAHTIVVRAVDNFGNVDDSPYSVSIDARDIFAPELSFSVRDGESFVVPFTTPTLETMDITITATVDFYFGAIRDYYIYTSTGLADTTTDNVLSLAGLPGGDYWVKVVANDIGGNSTADSVNFSVVVLNAHQGILGVNGIDWATYGSEAVNVWDNAVPFGNFPHFKWWDVFLIPPGGGRPFADSVLGTGSIPDWMFDTTYFAAIAWFGNEFSGDEAYWIERETAIMNYLNSGGKLVLATRFAYDFFFEELDAFAGTSPDDWVIGANPASATAVGDSLTNMTRSASHSFTDVPGISGPNSRVLFRDPANPTKALGFIAEPPGVGKFCFIGGRGYRWTNADLKGNLDVIYRFYFGMRDQY